MICDFLQHCLKSRLNYPMLGHKFNSKPRKFTNHKEGVLDQCSRASRKNARKWYRYLIFLKISKFDISSGPPNVWPEMALLSIYPIVYKYNIFQSQKTLKNAIFRLKIPHFPRLFSSPGIPCQQIPHFLVSTVG